MTVRAPQYIYDPRVIEAALANRPHLRHAVGGRLLARPANAFPQARCSPWQIARILGATQRYRGPALVADDLERCLAAGLRLRWLTTSSRRQLRSGLAEVRTACELLRHGFVVEDLDDGKGQSRVPELAARNPELEMGVEVYAPRDWQRLDGLTDAMADHLRNLDAPADYDIELVIGPLSRFDDEGVLASLHPGMVDAGLDDDVCGAVIASVMDRIVTAVRNGASHAEATHSVASLNLKVEAVLTDIRPASKRLPRRDWIIRRWPASGYAPEGMFDRLARRRVRQKMVRGQAAAAGLTTSLLMVDLAEFPLVEEWEHGFYRRSFEGSLARHVARDLMGH